MGQALLRARCTQLLPASWINWGRRAARLLLQAAAGAGPYAAGARRRVPGDRSAGTLLPTDGDGRAA